MNKHTTKTNHSLVRQSGRGLAALIFSLGILAVAPAHAVTVVLGTGNLENSDPTFSRPGSGTPPTSVAGPGYIYDVLPFTITTSGNWTFDILASATGDGTLSDPYLIIYENTFDPLQPLLNALGADDDSGDGLNSRLVLTLAAGTQYYAVTTSFNSGDTGTYVLQQSDPPPPPVDYVAQYSALTSGVGTANLHGQTVTSAMQGLLGDVNGRLFNLRSGGGEVKSDNGGIASTIDDGVIMGQGDGPEDKSPIARVVPRAYQWEVYTTVNYANISQSSIGSQAGVDSESWAPGVGVERHLTPQLAIGFAANLLETRQTYNNSLGSLNIDGFALSAYTSYVRRSFWVDALYNFGRLELESDRNPGFAFPMAKGDTTAHTNAVQLNGGWNFRFQDDSLVTGPFVGLEYLHVDVDAYSEQGGGAAALAFAKRSTDSLVTRVGWSVSKAVRTDFARITPQLRVSYERQNMSNNNGTSVQLINQPFQASVNSESPGQDYLVAGAGVNFEFTPALSLLLTYQGQFFREDMQAHFGGVRLSYKF